MEEWVPFVLLNFHTDSYRPVFFTKLSYKASKSTPCHFEIQLSFKEWRARPEQLRSSEPDFWEKNLCGTQGMLYNFHANHKTPKFMHNWRSSAFRMLAWRWDRRTAVSYDNGPSSRERSEANYDWNFHLQCCSYNLDICRTFNT